MGDAPPGPEGAAVPIHMMYKSWVESILAKSLLPVQRAVSRHPQCAIYRSPSGPYHSLGAAGSGSVEVEANRFACASRLRMNRPAHEGQGGLSP